MVASMSSSAGLLAGRHEGLGAVEEGDHVVGPELHEHVAVGGAELDHRDGQSGVVETGPHVHVAVAGRLHETVGEQRPGEGPADRTRLGLEHQRHREGVPRVVGEVGQHLSADPLGRAQVREERLGERGGVVSGEVHESACSVWVPAWVVRDAGESLGARRCGLEGDGPG